MAEQLNLNINVGGNATTSIGQIKKELKEANAELISAQTNFGEYSKEAINSAKKVAQLKDRIQEARETADLFDPGKKFQALSGALSSVAGGFSAVQGAVSLLGVESDDLQKQLLKVQSALALSQGLSVISDSAKDFQRLKTIIVNEVIPAIKALGTAAQVGIGLLVAAVVGAIVAWKEYIDTQEQVQKAAEETNKALEKGSKTQLEGELAAIDRESKLQIARLKGKKDNERAIFEEEQLARKLRINALERFYEQQKNKDGEAAQKALNDILNLQNEIKIAEITFNNEQAAREDEKNRVLKEKRDKRAKDEYDAFVNHVNTLKSQSDAEIELQKFLIDEKKKKDQEYFDWQVTQAQKAYDQTEAEVELQKYLYEKDVAAKRYAEDVKVQIVSNAIQSLGFLFDRGSAMAKAAALAGIGIDTAQGMIKGYRIAQEGAAAGGPAAPFLMPLYYSQQLLALFSAVAKAKQVLAAPKGGGSFSFPTPTGPAPLAPMQPTANLTALNQETINALGNQAIRAYVIETDMTTNQQRIQAIRQRARFG